MLIIHYFSYIVNYLDNINLYIREISNDFCHKSTAAIRKVQWTGSNF